MRPIMLLLLLLAGAGAEADELVLTYLANEGFLISAGDDQVLIDAFVAQPYSIYIALPQATAKQMLAATGPFGDIEVALASHVHRDHFQPGFAERFLRANTATIFVTSPQVLDTLRGVTNIAPRSPARGETASWSRGAIRIEFFNLPHGSGPFARIDNLVHLIHIGGFSVLHIGDAAMDEIDFAPHDFAARDIDVALIPYWYFASGKGRALIGRYLQARLQIAMHVPSRGGDDANVDAVRAAGGVAIAERPLQSWTLAGHGQ